MKPTIQSCVLAASLALTSWCFAQAAPAADPAAPEAKPKAEATPLQQRITDLITQLASDDFAKRDQASDELTKLGAEALPALREALKSEDPSIRSYAEYLVPKIEGRRDPRANRRGQTGARLDDPALIRQWDVAGGRVAQNQLILPRAARIAVNVAANNGQKTTSIVDGTRQITITEDANGIKITVIDTKDAKAEAKEYEAKSIEELRKEQPEAAQIYDQYTNRGRVWGAVNTRVLRLNPGGPAAIDNDALQLKIQDEIKLNDAKVAEQMALVQQLQEKALAERDARVRDFRDLAKRNQEQVQVEQLKAETEALEAELVRIEALHKQLLARTKAAQQRLAELEKQQDKK